MLLVAFKGMPGTGKSTLARALARELRWPLIDKDDIKDILDGHAPESGGLAYETMYNLVRRQVLLGLDVICDSPLTFEHGYRRLCEIASESNTRLLIIESICTNEATWQKRIEARKPLGLPAHHQTDWQAFQVYRQQFSAQTAYPIDNPRLFVDTLRPLAEVLNEITAWLTEHRGIE